MLCMTFNDNLNFPPNRSELYANFISALLRRWLASKSIPHEEIYKHLSDKRKIEMLSEIACKTFQNDEYLIKQKDLEGYIADFIKISRKQKRESLVPDSYNILKAIEVQHGFLVERTHNLYTFSHLTIQEYFTACYIVENRPETLKSLINCIADEKWREVFLLTVEQLNKNSADSFFNLMKKSVTA